MAAAAEVHRKHGTVSTVQNGSSKGGTCCCFHKVGPDNMLLAAVQRCQYHWQMRDCPSLQLWCTAIECVITRLACHACCSCSCSHQSTACQEGAGSQQWMLQLLLPMCSQVEVEQQFIANIELNAIYNPRYWLNLASAGSSKWFWDDELYTPGPDTLPGQCPGTRNWDLI